MSRALAWIVAAGLVLVAVAVVWSTRRTPAPPRAQPAAVAPPQAAAQPDPGPAAARPSPPVAPAPRPPSTGAEAEPAPLSPDASPDRLLLRGALDAALAEHLDRVKLSPDQLDTLTDAALTLRQSREALRALPTGPEHAEERRALLEASAEANATFTRVLGMTPGEFTEAVQPDVGVDAFDPHEEIPEPEYIEAPE